MNKNPDKSFRKTTTKLLAIAFVAITVLLLVLSLVMRAELLRIVGDAKKLSDELSELESEGRRLKIALESKTDLADIEDKAKSELGMQPLSPWQKQTIDTDIGDNYELIGNDEDKGISSVTEYFGFG